jgi:aromatic ring-cleaving dioxygenase
MDDKKKRDTLASMRSQMKMISKRLNDTSYAEIWPQLKLQKQKLDIAIKKMENNDIPESSKADN